MSIPGQGPAVSRQASESERAYASSAAAYEQATGYPLDQSQAEAEEVSVGAWTGRALAGFLMILAGLYGFLVGLAAVLKGGFYVYSNNYVYHWSTYSWGWLHLILGVVIVAAGVCVLFGMLWARIAGVILAAFSAVANFLFIPFYPVWSIIVIAVDIFIIWALVSAGRRQPA